MKKKLIIMGICALALLLVFLGNVYKRFNQGKGGSQTGQETILRVGDMMTVQESLRLLKFLGIEVDTLTGNLSSDSTNPQFQTEEDNYLQFKDCISLLNFVCLELDLNSENIQKRLTFHLQDAPENQAVLTEEFLSLYESILTELGPEASPVVEKTMYILGSFNPTDEETQDTVMATDQGTYKYENAASYERFYTNETEDNDFHLEKYIDSKIVAMVSGSDLVYVKNVLNEDTILHNVWITNGSKSSVSTFLYNISKKFNAKYELTQKIENKIGDLVIRDGKVVKISIKPDIIDGKVLVANQKYIEIEGYGKIPLDDNYKIYKIYGEMSMEVTNSILVGYEATDFVVADGKIAAALIKETINARNIRVLIKTNNYENIYHQEVKLTSDRDYIVTIGDKKTKYKKGKVLTLSPGDNLLAKGRIQVQTVSESGKIKILSLNRTSGVPAYRGSIEISSAEDGLVVINELPIEEYLYAVLPSEMPSSYGLEALKAQAICARSYAYNQLFANGYSDYGAHVDDSVSYQVYNNIAEDENSILAVKDTYGKVINYDNSVITAFYFSTSCGHTSSLQEVWKDAQKADYLVGKLQTVIKQSEVDAVSVASDGLDKTDFSSEAAFRSFILEPEETTYDSKFPWYRWKVTISMTDLKKSIDNSLSQRYNANPLLIQTLDKDKNNGNNQYESMPISTIGEVKDVKIGKREKSGILSELILIGSEATIKVSSEYNIRCLLAPMYDQVIRQDGSTATDLSMLPSAFFIVDKKGKTVILQGGGYGHGVGMSQNGAKAMADSGLTFEDIINHFYTGVKLGYIY